MASLGIEFAIQNKLNNSDPFRNYNRYPDQRSRYPDQRSRYTDQRPRRKLKGPKMNIYTLIFSIINWIIFIIAMVLALKCGTFGHIISACCCSPFYLIYRLVYPC